MPAQPNLAIVGATGAVGCEFLRVLEERSFPHGRLRLLASPRSAGRSIPYCGTEVPVEALGPQSFVDIDVALFSAGSSVSRQWAPKAVEAGATVIDNSSAFRMDRDVPLVVPEVNGHVLDDFEPPGIIANPNCSTIIALVAVTPIHRAAGIERMVVATYQAASGAGAAMMAELEAQAREYASGKPLTTAVSGRQYIFNVFSHNSAIGPDGVNEEERKLVRESHKIWNDHSVGITATCVRVPVLRAHTEAINLALASPMTEDEAREVLSAAAGVRVVDDRAANKFPEPIDASGVDEVLVGRIRADESLPPGRGLNLLVSGDQLRKGAALNAVQIAEWLVGRAAPV